MRSRSGTGWPRAPSIVTPSVPPAVRCSAWASVNEMSTSSGRPGSGSRPDRILRCHRAVGTVIARGRDQGDHGRVHGHERAQRRPGGDLREPLQRGGREVGEGRLAGLRVDQHVGRPGPGRELRVRRIGPAGPRPRRSRSPRRTAPRSGPGRASRASGCAARSRARGVRRPRSPFLHGGRRLRKGDGTSDRGGAGSTPGARCGGSTTRRVLLPGLAAHSGWATVPIGGRCGRGRRRVRWGES